MTAVKSGALKPVICLNSEQVGTILIGNMNEIAKFHIGQIVRHRYYPFRGVIFDVDPEFSSSEEWWLSIPENIRPRKDQPFYHLLAENEETTYIAYVSEQNLQVDDSGEPVSHPQVTEIFSGLKNGVYKIASTHTH